MAPRITLDELNKLIADFGKEDYLAERVAHHREGRGWSQHRLSKEMANAGCPIPQSAISKIENPLSGGGGRRGITVDEAIGFSKVFGIPLTELVLPRAAMESVTFMRILRDAPVLLTAAQSAELQYQQLLEQAVAIVVGDSDAAEILFGEFSKAEERWKERGSPEEYTARHAFLVDATRGYETARKEAGK